DVEETTTSISNALEKAERTSGIPIEHAFVSFSGSNVIAQPSEGVIAVGRADNEISEEDVSRVIEAASAVSLPANYEILHVIPKSFTVDNQEGVKDPVGMNGIRLKVETLIIEGSTSNIKNLSKCISRSGLEIDDLVTAPLAISYSLLNKKQKDLGIASIDIGSGTTGLIVFEEGDIIHTSILPVGSEHITNDLAIGLRTSIDTAEKVKLEYGYAKSADINKKDKIDLSKLDPKENQIVTKKHIAEIIEARLSEIFAMVNRELKNIRKAGKLPAGTILSGGGVKLPGIVDLAKQELKLPAQIGFPENVKGVIEKLDDPTYATVVGLIFWGKSHTDKQKSGMGMQMSSVSDTVGKIRGWFKNFLP
ncbi:MAG: cell division protein FtsA, partial [Parcubacteria group bacterium]|nr:cell division protein FtsA [Parcubacteria group bacterium]